MAYRTAGMTKRHWLAMLLSTKTGQSSTIASIFAPDTGGVAGVRKFARADVKDLNKTTATHARSLHSSYTRG